MVGNTLDAAGAADMLLKPKKTNGKTYLKIVDFVDNICQKDDERLLAEHGIKCLMINYGPRRLKLHEILMQQYSGILHSRKWILRKRDTAFLKVSSYKKVFSRKKYHFLIIS